MSDETLQVFQIGIVGSSSSNVTNALYANGNHQCRVTIDILKVDGAYNKAPLTPSEVLSLTVLPYSDQLFPPQAQGWSCHDTKNQYTPNLWSRSYAAQPPESPYNVDMSPRSDVPERFERYMQTGSLQSQRFMACVTLDNGNKYSTHYNGADGTFESYVDIVPQGRYTLRVSDLSLTREDAYTNNNEKYYHIDVDTYYWSLPGGLWILGESFSNAGWWNEKLEWAFCLDRDGWVRMGTAIKLGITNVCLGDIDGAIKSEYWNDQVPLVATNFALRAARYANEGSSNAGDYDRSLYWTITDNYGWSSRFVLRAKDNGNTLTLEDAPL